VKPVLTATIKILSFTLVISFFAVAQQPSQPNKDECSVPTYTGKDLDKHPTILAKPEPDYIAAARKIQFIAGEKNGVKVSRPVILKYFVTR
jgi:hypothetical protein